MMPLLSLAHLTVMETDPIGLIDAASAGGFDAIGLRIVSPTGGALTTEVIGDPPLQRRIKARLAETGLALLDIEAIWLSPGTEIAALEPALDTGAELGARYVLVCGDDPDRHRMTANFAGLAEAAQQRGLRTMLEFIPYTQLRSLADAHALLVDAMAANAGLLVDALHLSRSGGRPADIAQYDPALFSYTHLCDAPATLPPPDGLRAEARGDRLYPGEGSLWLHDFIAAFPPGTPTAIEAPSARHAGLPPLERARLAGNACRRLLQTLDGDRAPPP